MFFSCVQISAAFWDVARVPVSTLPGVPGACVRRVSTERVVNSRVS